MLTIQGLMAHRAKKILFSNLTFSLCGGDFCLVSGPNGSGKTTLLKILAGLIPIEIGKIIWQNRNLTEVFNEYIHQVNYLGHQLACKSILSPLENLSWWTKTMPSSLLSTLPTSKELKTLSIEESFKEKGFKKVHYKKEDFQKKEIKEENFHEKYIHLLKTVGLNNMAAIKTGYLSCGQQKRLALLRLKISPAKIWILDEPLNSLDEEGVSWFVKTLLDHLQQGGIAIMSSHIPLPLSLKNRKQMIITLEG